MDRKVVLQVAVLIATISAAGSKKTFGQNNSLAGGKRPPAYAPVREADIMWMKRIWRRVDLRQKMNHPFYFPENPAEGRKSLFEYLRTAVLEGSILAYDPGPLGDDDMFTRALTHRELEKLLLRKDTVYTASLTDPDVKVPQEVDMSVRSSDVLQYELKEDWFFDRQRSVMEVRIVGICPLLMVKDDVTGEFKGFKRLFWIDMKAARNEMAQWPAFNRWNDFEQRSYDEIFQKRQFASYIVKESNVYNRYINQYKHGEEALLESDKIQQDLMTMEHDLWCY